MAGNTKNLGQVAGVHIGNTPPSNIVLIWYDNTPSQKRHKVYDPTLQQWVVLDQNIISAITYSELVNMAKNTGLSVGEWFQITDRSNALALAVTSTKVQYSDAIGNILIDDLGTNIQYHVTSSNLSIDDVVGVFDEVNKKLVFQFNEYTPDFTADDYLFGKVKRTNVWSLAKYKLSSFLSKVTGNSITWNGGFFFSFSNELKNALDKKGGVVSKDTYDSDKAQLETSINNVGKDNQSIIQNTQAAITKETTDDAIYGKKLPSISTTGEPIDVAKGDTLLNIVAKFQRWVNRFKYATGIRVSTDFAAKEGGLNINNNDTVDNALRKVQGNINKFREDITVAKHGDKIKVSTGEETSILTPTEVTEEQHDITYGESIKSALQKFLHMCTQIRGWQIVNNSIPASKVENLIGVNFTNIVYVCLSSGISSGAFVDPKHYKVGVAIGEVGTIGDVLVHGELSYIESFVPDNGRNKIYAMNYPITPNVNSRNGFVSVDENARRYMGQLVFPFVVPKFINRNYLLVQLLISFDDTEISGSMSGTIQLARGVQRSPSITPEAIRINGSNVGVIENSFTWTVNDTSFNYSIEMYIPKSTIQSLYSSVNDFIDSGNLQIWLNLAKPFL